MNKVREWFSQLEKTQKYILIFILLSFTIILSLSLYNFINNNDSNNTNNLISDKLEMKDEVNDEDSKDNKEDQSDKEKEQEDKKNQTDEERQPAVSKPLHDSTNTDVDHDGSKEESKEEKNNYLNVFITIKGLEDKIIISQTMQIEEGSSAFEALSQLCKENSLSLNATGFKKTMYVTEINGLKEKAHGPKSGWKYNINGEYVSNSAGGYILKEDDVMEWYYVYD